jgi:hypothetical protein
MAYIYVEVFKTSVEHSNEAKELLKILQTHFPECSFNFDLDDCDRILRAQGVRILQEVSCVIQVVAATGHRIEVLQE